MQPLLLVLDDLHAADEPSRLLLEFLVRQLRGARLLVVGTFRDTEAVRFLIPQMRWAACSAKVSYSALEGWAATT